MSSHMEKAKTAFGLTGCACYTCIDVQISKRSTFAERLAYPMVLCAQCGAKRCPHATHHDNPCTNSNEPGQKGSRYQ